METARGSVEVREPTRLERANARRVAESKATIPHLYLEGEIEVDAELDRAQLTARLVKAVATALREHPTLNGAYRDGRFEVYSRVNIGLTVQAQETAVAPTIFDADAKRVDEIAEEARELETAARDGSLASPQLAGGTFTVTAAGTPAVTRVVPVIAGGQAAHLALGGVRGGSAAITLACDHRLVGVAEGAAFLEALEASFADLR